jgi:hypothetical protein
MANGEHITGLTHSLHRRIVGGYMKTAAAKGESEARTRKRGAYPYYPLKRCIEVARAVHSAGGGRGDVQRSVLAHQLGVGDDSAVFIQLVGAARSFGLIEGWGVCTLSDLAKEYFMPTDDGQKQKALVKMLKGPVVFEKLIDRFDGNKVPSTDLLVNILRRDYQVGESWVARTASLFLDALGEAGVIDEGGFLRYESALHSSQTRCSSEIKKSAQATVLTIDPASVRPIDPSRNLFPPEDAKQRPDEVVSVPFMSNPNELNTWTFRLGGGTVRLQTSHDLSLALWEKLNQYVQVLRPNDLDNGVHEANH